MNLALLVALFCCTAVVAVENLDPSFENAEAEYQRAAQENLRRRMQGEIPPTPPMLCDFFGGEAGFFHSVASGDPLPEAVIIWTRYTPCNGKFGGTFVALAYQLYFLFPQLTMLYQSSFAWPKSTQTCLLKTT